MLSTTPRAIFDFAWKDPRFQLFPGRLLCWSHVDDRPLMRAYSIASANWDEQPEFYSIIIQDGALTSRCSHSAVTSLLSAKAVGTLTTRGLNRWEKAFMLSMGTGLLPLHH